MAWQGPQAGLHGWRRWFWRDAASFSWRYRGTEAIGGLRARANPGRVESDSGQRKSWPHGVGGRAEFWRRHSPYTKAITNGVPWHSRSKKTQRSLQHHICVSVVGDKISVLMHTASKTFTKGSAAANGALAQLMNALRIAIEKNM